MPTAATRLATMRVVYVLPEPTPYRTPLLDRVAAEPGIDLHVVYASTSVQGRSWSLEPAHPHTILRGISFPGARRLLLHDYPVDLGIVRELLKRRPEVLVVAGWSTFAAQVALVWALLRRVPYVVSMESHDAEPRAGWRRELKRCVLPWLLTRAASVLVTGSLARRYAESFGVAPDRIGVWANTIDVEAVAAEVERLRLRRAELRAGLGIASDEVAVLCAARLVPEKGLDTLAAAAEGLPGVRVLVAGEGPERRTLESRAGLSLLGSLDAAALREAYAAADVFALLSRREPWGVVVNEAAASGLPLLLSDRVGAAADLLRPGENGELVPADDIPAARAALERLAADPVLRARYGERSRAIVSGWGYEPSVASFLAAVRTADDTHQRSRS